MKKERFQDLPEIEQEWVDAYLSGNIDNESFENLQERMLESTELRSMMRRYLSLDTSLHAQAIGEVSPWTELEEEKFVPKVQNIIRIFPIAAAAAVAFFLGLGLMHFGSKANNAVRVAQGRFDQFEQSEKEPQAQGFAVVGGIYDVAWGDQQGVLLEGDTLGAESLRLAAGTVEIQFFSGAMMTLEGPAEISLKSAWEASCVEGSVRMRVPPAARGFKLNAPSTAIVDLGTEFGLEVRGGKGHVEVFDGEIALTHQGEKEQILKKGRAMGLDPNGPSVDVTSGQVAFPDAGRFGVRAAQELRSDYERWEAHRDALAGDKRLLAYYTFDQGLAGGLMPNLTIPRNPEFDGAVVMAEPVDGRWPGLSSGLEFRRPGSRVRVNIPGEFSAFTFSCWVRVDSLDRQYSALFMGDGYENGEPHWQIRNDGKMMLSVMVDETRQHPVYPESRYHHVYFSPLMWDRSMSGQWLHLTSVLDPANEIASHYVNGKRVSRESIKSEFLIKDLRIGNGEIGNWGQPFREDPSFAIRNLNGRMDEMMIFRTALDDEEIKALYEESRVDGR